MSTINTGDSADRRTEGSLHRDGWDAACNAVDSYDHEIKILTEAQRIIEKNELPRHSWQTWDVFAGRMVDNLEATDRWTLRVLQQARENTQHPNDQAETRRTGDSANQKPL